jgi:hypothetical protein
MTAEVAGGAGPRSLGAAAATVELGAAASKRLAPVDRSRETSLITLCTYRGKIGRADVLLMLEPRSGVPRGSVGEQSVVAIDRVQASFVWSPGGSADPSGRQSDRNLRENIAFSCS